MSIKRLEDKLDQLDAKLDEKLENINERLGEYNTELKLHIEGVRQNRVAVAALTEKVQPIETHVLKVQTVIAIVKWLGAGGLLAGLAGIAKYLGIL